LPALALLTPIERAALGLAASDDLALPNGSSLLAAASGLAKLASAHLGRRMVEDDNATELTRKDRLALAFAPRLGLDVHQRMTTDEGPANGHDPILALLEGSQDDGPDHVVVSARLDLGSRGTDGADES
jgi:hypothetical protein